MNTLLLSIFGIWQREGKRYNVLLKEDLFEVRQYQKGVLARVELPGSYREASEEGVKIFEEYLEGNNFKGQKMNWPFPIYCQSKATGWEISFFLPSSFSVHTAPCPLNKLIKLSEVPSHKVAVFRYSGKNSRKLLQAKIRELQEWLDSRRLQPSSPPRTARYGPLSYIPFFKVNEIHMDVI